MRHQRDAAFGRLRRAAEQLSDFEQLVPVVHARYAVLLERGVIDRVLARQRRRVRPRRSTAKLRAANLDRYYRLAPLRRELGDLDELARVLEALDEHGDYGCVVVIEQVASKVRSLQVRLVAGRDDVGESDAPSHGARQERSERRCSALAHQADVAAPKLHAFQPRR